MRDQGSQRWSVWIKKEIPELTGVQSEEILSGMKKVTEMPDGAKKAKSILGYSKSD